MAACSRSSARAGRLAASAPEHRPVAGARCRSCFDAGFYALEELARELEEYARASISIRRGSRRSGAARSAVRAPQEVRPDARGRHRGRARRARELDLLDTASFDLRALETREKRRGRRARRGRARSSPHSDGSGAKRLADAVDEVLPELGMPDGKFAVALDARAEPVRDGAEDVEFRVSLNVGHDERPLARVASGGELSRVMLALKTILARLDHVPTLIFDEVDAGIGGRVGLQVGETLRRVANDHQVFAISHLPQIAARAHHHIVVAKGAQGGVTTADVASPGRHDRIPEIARMLGGDPESATSRAHAASCSAPQPIVDPQLDLVAPELRPTGIAVNCLQVRKAHLHRDVLRRPRAV